MISSSSSSSCSSLYSLFASKGPQDLLKRGIRPSIQSLNRFLLLLFESQKLRLLLHIFSQISSNAIQINSRTHSLVSRALLSSQRFDEAQHFIANSQNLGFPHKRSLFDSLIRGLSTVGEDPEKAFSLVKECIKDHGILPSPTAFRLLASSFSSRGEMGRAIEVFEMTRDEKVGCAIDDFVCSSIISGFSKIGKPEMGVEFYDRLRKIDGFKANLVTYTAVADALCRGGRVEEARELVSEMEKDGVGLDVVLYSSWIDGCFKKGLLMEGIKKYKLMVENGIMPDNVSYTILIDGLCKEGNVEKVIGFLEEMEKNGLQPNAVTYTALIQGFCKRGKLEEAFFVLRRMEGLGIVVDEFAYTILIDVLCRAGDLGRAFELLEEMERKGIEAGHVTYNAVMNGMCKAGETRKADEMLKGFCGDNSTYSTLLHRYTKEKDVEGVKEIKRRLGEADICIDVITCNVLIKALFMAGMVEDAWHFFEGMPNMALVANDVTYCTVIDGLCKLGIVHRALEVFDQYRRTLLVSGAACHNCVIVALCKERRVEMAAEVFIDLIKTGLLPHSSIYRKLIQIYFEEDKGEGVVKFIHKIEELEPHLLSSICNDAVNLLCGRSCFAAALDVQLLMRRRGLAITSKSYYVLLKSLLRNGSKEVAQLIMTDSIKAFGISGWRMINVLSIYLCKKNVEVAIRFLSGMRKKIVFTSVLTAVVESLKKEGRVQDALKFLIEAEENGTAGDLVVYSIVVDGLCKEGYLEKALDLCASMRKKGIHPNIVIYNSVINGLCHQGCLVEAFRLFDSLEHNNVLPTVITYATLISALSREGFLGDASQLFERMILKGVSPNTRIYNSLINGYCSFGLIEEALKFLMDMEQNCLQPDDFTVSAVISGCCLRGDMEAAQGFFSEFKRRGLYPDFLGFSNLIKGLFAKGRMEEARSILRDMFQCTAIMDLINKAGDELHVESLGSLLGLACEQGRIQEIVLVLNEVRFVAFSSWRPNSENRLKWLKHLGETVALDADIQMIGYGTGGVHPMVAEIPRCTTESLAPKSMIADTLNMYHSVCKMEKAENCTNDYENLMGKSLYYDFDTHYSIVASLCAKGELQKANSVIRELLLNSGENQ